MTLAMRFVRGWVGGISVIKTADPDKIERILEVALDGLRFHARQD